MTQQTIIQKAEADIAAKEREIAELRQFILMYKKLDGSLISQGPNPSSNLVSWWYKGKGDAARQIAMEFYNKTKQPVRSRDILSAMEDRGHGILGENKLSVLAGYLKEGNTLKSNAGLGWTPVESGKNNSLENML